MCTLHRLQSNGLTLFGYRFLKDGAEVQTRTAGGTVGCCWTVGVRGGGRVSAASGLLAILSSSVALTPTRTVWHTVWVSSTCSWSDRILHAAHCDRIRALLELFILLLASLSQSSCLALLLPLHDIVF